MDFDTVVLAGGRGERMKEVTQDKIPKVMLDFNGKPFLEYILDLLKRQGITKLTLCVGHLCGEIINHFGGGGNHGLDISYVIDHPPRLLGTAGCLPKVLEHSSAEDFLVLNGDTYNSRLDVKEFYDLHKELGGLVTMCVTEGVIDLGKDIVSVDPGEGGKTLVMGRNIRAQYNTGSYFINRKVIAGLKPDEYKSLENDVFPELGTSELLFGYVVTYKEGYILDMGTPAGYKEVLEYVGMDKAVSAR